MHGSAQPLIPTLSPFPEPELSAPVPAAPPVRPSPALPLAPRLAPTPPVLARVLVRRRILQSFGFHKLVTFAAFGQIAFRAVEVPTPPPSRRRRSGGTHQICHPRGHAPSAARGRAARGSHPVPQRRGSPCRLVRQVWRTGRAAVPTIRSRSAPRSIRPPSPTVRHCVAHSWSRGRRRRQRSWAL